MKTTLKSRKRCAFNLKIKVKAGNLTKAKELQRKISAAIHREESRAGQKIGYVITVKYPKNTQTEA